MWCWGRLIVSAQLHTELWTSWASLLRSYAAAHGMNSRHNAIVEVSADEIIFRVNDRWLRFTATAMQHSGEPAVGFALTEHGNVRLNGGPPEEMDLAAERLAREMLQNPR